MAAGLDHGAHRRARLAALSMAFLAAGAAVVLFLQYASTIRLDTLDLLRGAFIGITTFWLAWGASQSVVGLFYRRAAVPRLADDFSIEGRTVLLLPIYEEDPREVFARLEAVDASIAAEGLTEHIDIAVLSDTRDETVAQAETYWFQRLVTARCGTGRMFYRRRPDNTGKKAGNIEEFIRNSGGRYEYALMLDADSLIEGATIGEMIRRMEACPDLGLIQTLPKIVRARSRFGRAMQFAASFYSPIFGRGLAMMQGRTGPFWGHNGLVRVRAFAYSCALPTLSGRPPFGGHIMSHDYVEAAMLARAGWQVRLDPDLEGSFEEGPDDILAFAKRDRRWCQGNLQYLRLLDTPGLKLWSRFVFVQAILSYLTPLLWLGLLIVSIPAAVRDAKPDYFPTGQSLFPVFPSDETTKAISLLVGIVCLLILPKLLILTRSLVAGTTHPFGGRRNAAASMFCELLFTTVTAPILLMFQTRSVFQVFMRLDAGWPVNQRGESRLSVARSWAASWWITATGLLGLVLCARLAPELMVWMLPVTGPMVLAPLVMAWSAHTGGRASCYLFAVPQERAPSGVLRRFETTRRVWGAESQPLHVVPPSGQTATTTG